jgi:hypothetical protein
MPDNNDRPSLDTSLESRYARQKAGGAFDVKERLKGPGQSPKTGDRMPIGGNEALYTNKDFAVKPLQGVTEFLDAQDANNSPAPKSKEKSRYMKGFSNRKYKG